jgi:hypothetical protein
MPSPPITAIRKAAIASFSWFFYRIRVCHPAKGQPGQTLNLARV